MCEWGTQYILGKGIESVETAAIVPWSRILWAPTSLQPMFMRPWKIKRHDPGALNGTSAQTFHRLQELFREALDWVWGKTFLSEWLSLGVRGFICVRECECAEVGRGRGEEKMLVKCSRGGKWEVVIYEQIHWLMYFSAAPKQFTIPSPRLGLSRTRYIPSWDSKWYESYRAKCPTDSNMPSDRKKR